MAFFLSKLNEAGGTEVSEAVATVGKGKITRQEWLNELEAKYGKNVLKDMIDQKVINELANKYNITISDEDVDREYQILKLTYNSPEENKTSEEKWKEQIRNSLLQEEILTKDVVISEKEMKEYYEKNEELFSIPSAYHLSHIIIETKEEANRTMKELSEGSSFEALAMEQSIEEFSANEGGNIGYIMASDERYPSEYVQEAKKLKEGKYSDPIKVEQGWAIIKLEGTLKGKKYAYKDVKQQIRREIALDQIKVDASTETLWEEAKVKWFYGRESY